MDAVKNIKRGIQEIGPPVGIGPPVEGNSHDLKLCCSLRLLRGLLLLGLLYIIAGPGIHCVRMRQITQ